MLKGTYRHVLVIPSQRLVSPAADDDFAKTVPTAFHNGSNYDDHFIIKKEQKNLKKQFTCLRENTDKCIAFTVPIEKEVTGINKIGEESTRNICYILPFIDSTRFIANT